MNEYDEAKRMVDRSAEIAGANLKKGQAAAEQSFRVFEQGFSVSAESVRDFNVKVIDMAQVNTEAFFDFTRKLTAARAPSDIIQLWTEYARKQVETLTEQTQALTALGQKIAGDAAQPLNRVATQFTKSGWRP